jgi:hypothetical protein
MKYLVMLGLLCAPAITYAQEIVVVKERNEYYAVVTDCQAQGRPLQVTIKKLERGEQVRMKTRKGRLKCQVKKVVQIT